jgi:hypothetical protein
MGIFLSREKTLNENHSHNDSHLHFLKCALRQSGKTKWKSEVYLSQAALSTGYPQVYPQEDSARVSRPPP